jgi:hypothetical protein
MRDEAHSADALPTLPVREGYDLWAEVYDSDGNPLIALEHLGEHSADASLAANHPRAEKYVGWPMLFLMRAARR